MLHVKYYLAGSYNRRDALMSKANEISKCSNESIKIECVSRWLQGNAGSPSAQVAEWDMDDVRAADVLVIESGLSTTGGKWVELGMALALNKPVLFLRKNIEEDRHTPVFITMCSRETSYTTDNCTIADYIIGLYEESRDE